MHRFVGSLQVEKIEIGDRVLMPAYGSDWQRVTESRAYLPNPEVLWWIGTDRGSFKTFRQGSLLVAEQVTIEEDPAP